jgi:hypothetical protein
MIWRLKVGTKRERERESEMWEKETMEARTVVQTRIPLAIFMYRFFSERCRFLIIFLIAKLSYYYM